MNFEQRKKEEALKKIALVFKWWILTVNSGKSGTKKAHKAIGDIIDNLLSDYKKELVEKFEKIGEETFESNKISCLSCGEPVKDTDILVKDTWIYRDLVSLLQKDKENKE